jgi:hypothetical protein
MSSNPTSDPSANARPIPVTDDLLEGQACEPSQDQPAEQSVKAHPDAMDKMLTAKFERACAVDERLRPQWNGERPRISGLTLTDFDLDELVAAKLASAASGPSPIPISTNEIAAIVKAAPYNRERVEPESYWLEVAEKGAKNSVVPCPNCDDGHVVQRRNRNTGLPFWACSNYPHCKYTEEFEGVPPEEIPPSEPTPAGSQSPTPETKKQGTEEAREKFVAAGFIAKVLDTERDKDRAIARLKEEAAKNDISLSDEQAERYYNDALNKRRSWRAHVRSKGELTTKPPRFLISQLFQEKALSAIVAPAFNCKTWFALQAAKAISTGSPLWGFEGPSEPVPVIYHVPEMYEALFRQYMDKVGAEDSEMFLVRTMEQGVWELNDPRMMESSKGRVLFLDTMGYFNPADETSDYTQSLRFAKLVYGLLNAGCRGVIGLYHPPKYSSKAKKPVWTLEDSILGSAGYGGILRSCMRMKNLNPDLNDANPHVYVEGLKNPGLKPFQLHRIPLEMKVPPGKSQYLADLQKSRADERYEQACALFERGLSLRQVQAEMRPKPPSTSTLQKWRQKWRPQESNERTED